MKPETYNLPHIYKHVTAKDIVPGTMIFEADAAALVISVDKAARMMIVFWTFTRECECIVRPHVTVGIMGRVVLNHLSEDVIEKISHSDLSHETWN
jgi:hypothetical protein